MKAVGMMLIVFGHVAAWAPGATIPPINSKQLGVAFFVFITAFTLSRDRRPTAEVVVRRLFEFYLLALAVALAISAAGLATLGNAQESNYLPLVGGANLLFDNFPANPTTWYVGTYIHVIVLGALLRGRFRASWAALLLVAALETLIRAALLRAGLEFVPYMLFTNWASVYLLGALAATGGVRGSAAVGLVATAIVVAYWVRPDLTAGFPLWTSASGTLAGSLAASAAVTALYVGVTAGAYAAWSALPARVPAIVEFISRHTLMIFLAHMPLAFAWYPFVIERTGSRDVTAVVLLVTCTAVPAGISWALHRVVDFDRLRNRAAGLVRARMANGLPV
jgi:hypothetical protein